MCVFFFLVRNVLTRFDVGRGRGRERDKRESAEPGVTENNMKGLS